MKQEDIDNFLKNLDENTTYLVEVKTSENNPKHKAVLFVGFRTGQYCTVFNHTYEAPIPLKELYSMRMLTKLAKLKNS